MRWVGPKWKPKVERAYCTVCSSWKLKNDYCCVAGGHWIGDGDVCEQCCKAGCKPVCEEIDKAEDFDEMMEVCDRHDIGWF
jgi:hypothetical protein